MHFVSACLASQKLEHLAAFKIFRLLQLILGTAEEREVLGERDEGCAQGSCLSDEGVGGREVGFSVGT